MINYDFKIKSSVIGVIILILAGSSNIIPYASSSSSNTSIGLFDYDSLNQFTAGQEVHLGGHVMQYLTSSATGIPNAIYRVIDISNNSTIKNGYTDLNGMFSFTLMIPQVARVPGTISLQAIFDGVGDYQGSTSIPLSLHVISTHPQIVNPPNSDYIVIVETDKQIYTTGDNIIISGQVSKVIPDYPMILRIQSPNGNLITSQQLQISNRTFSTSIHMDGGSWIEGTYTVFAQYELKLYSAQTTFVIEKSTPAAPTEEETISPQTEKPLSNFGSNSNLPTAEQPPTSSPKDFPKNNTSPQMKIGLPGNSILVMIGIVAAMIVGVTIYFVGKSRGSGLKTYQSQIEP